MNDGTQRISGERRLPACRFRQPAENFLSVTLLDVVAAQSVAGKLPALQARSLRSQEFRASAIGFRHSNHAR